MLGRDALVMVSGTMSGTPPDAVVVRFSSAEILLGPRECAWATRGSWRGPALAA